MITKEKKQHTGDFKQYCIVRRYTTSSDGGFGDTQTFADSFSDWFNIRPLSGQKRLEFAKLDSTVTHEIKGRNGLDITNQDVIKCGDREFTIKFQYNEGEESYYTHFGAAEVV